jgi:uncharacterized membrane protein YidH (DUF202 family)
MERLRLAAILGLVGLLVGLGANVVYSVYLAPHAGLVPTVPAGNGTSNNSTGALRAIASEATPLLVLTGVGIAFLIVGAVLYRSVFRELRGLDDQFQTPSTLALLLAVGGAILFVGLVALFAALAAASGCLEHAATCHPGGLLGGLLGAALVIGIGGILALVGLIGTAIGIYRLGTRYSSGMLKLAGVFFVIPYLNVVGAVLTLVEAHAIRGRLEMAPPAAAAGPWGPPPPGYRP